MSHIDYVNGLRAFTKYPTMNARVDMKLENDGSGNGPMILTNSKKRDRIILGPAHGQPPIVIDDNLGFMDMMKGMFGM